MTEDSRSSWRELNAAVALLRIVEIRGLEIAFWIWVSTERRVVRPNLSIACMLSFVSMRSFQSRNDELSLRRYSSYLEQIHQLWIRGSLHWWEVTRAVGILCLRKFYGLQNRSPTARWKKCSWVRRLHPKMILFTIREETKSGRAHWEIRKCNFKSKRIDSTNGMNFFQEFQDRCPPFIFVFSCCEWRGCPRIAFSPSSRNLLTCEL